MTSKRDQETRELIRQVKTRREATCEQDTRILNQKLYFSPKFREGIRQNFKSIYS